VSSAPARLHHRDEVPAPLRGAIVALGNFDGFHRGHQAVVAQAVDWGRAEGRPVLVATFDPHPVRHFRPDLPPFRLTTLDQRETLFTGAGADAMLVFDFGEELAATTAQDFIDDVLVRHLHAHGVVTGADFRFGKGGTGDIDLLRASRAIATRVVDPVALGGDVVSSSRIRKALADGDPGEAARLMTRPFAIRGMVQHGDKVGRTIGYPTANLQLGPYIRPAYGIYAVTAQVLDSGQMLHGAANLGVRPQFDPPKELLEPYFFDFSGDLYGQEIEVALHHFIRAEAKFESLDALKAQMERDCEEAKRLLTAHA
jgi:riboflavin kinase/FMN adenylyltransferase